MIDRDKYMNIKKYITCIEHIEPIYGITSIKYKTVTNKYK
jgi:hypothetical protein